MDINIVYLIAVIAILVRIYVMDGYNFTPSKDNTQGKFQLNIALTVVFGLAAAIPVIAAMDLTGPAINVALAVFLGVYGAPSVLDRIGSIFVSKDSEIPAQIAAAKEPAAPAAAEDLPVDEEAEV